MTVLPQITGGRRVGLMCALLAVAVAGVGTGMYYSDFWWRAVIGVLAFIGYGLLINEPAPCRRRRGTQDINPASGSAIVPGTHTDSEGNYHGSTDR
jgi:hypothetical protein